MFPCEHHFPTGTMAISEFVTCQDAAEALGYTVQHIRRLARDGQLEGLKLGRDWVISRESVGEFLAGRENLELALSRGWTEKTRKQ